VPTALTIWNSESIVAFEAGVPLLDDAFVSPVKPVPTVKVSTLLVSTPIAPMSSSFATCVLAVAFEVGVVLVPVRVLIRSNIETAARPENSFTLTAFAAADGKVTVIVSPETSAVVSREEKMTVRTPAVPVPFAMSASRE
jgi:hypothetical protein